MGFFSGLFSAIGSFTKRLWQATKEVVSKAVGWLADKAETFVGAVSRVWNNVKEKYVAPALAWAREKAPWPWLKNAIGVFEDILLRFEESRLGKNLKEAIEWAIESARDLRSLVLSATELTAARIRKAVFGEAKEKLTEEQFKAIQLAERINDYVLTQSTIAQVLESNSVENFEHYLRLRAAQKLLRLSETTLASAKSINEITDDDHFLLEVTSELLAPIPHLSESDASRLDALIRKKFGGQGLIPFVFEDMVVAWQQNVESMIAEVNALVINRKRLEIQFDDLKMNVEIGIRLTDIDNAEMANLPAKIHDLSVRKDELDAKRRELKFYVDAAEGFLQILEGKVDDREYIADRAGEVGKIIIDCAQHGRQWQTLTESEQHLIEHFSNIFSGEIEKRIVTVEV